MQGHAYVWRMVNVLYSVERAELEYNRLLFNI